MIAKYTWKTIRDPIAMLSGMLGELIRETRNKAGLSQEKLAFMAGISRNYVSDLENDKSSPSLDMFFRLCDALKVSPTDLVAKLERKRKRRKRNK